MPKNKDSLTVSAPGETEADIINYFYPGQRKAKFVPDAGGGTEGLKKVTYGKTRKSKGGKNAKR